MNFDGMPIAKLISNAEIGDLLLYKSEGLISKIIRALTGESYNHVAILSKGDYDDIVVVEMREFVGFRESLLQERINKDCVGRTEIYYVRAPHNVREHPGNAVRAINALRGREYGYFALIRVWWSQIMNRKIPTRLVCSTAAESVWEACGVIFRETADPGDFAALGEMVVRIDCGG